MKKLLYIMAFSSLVLTSCEKDEINRPDSSLWEKAETTEQTEGSDLNLDTDLFQIKVDETKSFGITEGNGEYKVTVLDTEIAEAMIEGDAVKVTGKKQGTTEVVISDKNQNYKSVKIYVYLTDNLTIDQPEVTVELPYGKPAVQVVNITEGNGEYEVSSSCEDVATVSLDSSDPCRIIVNATKVGNAEITITDRHGLSAKVKVNVVSINSAFSDTELQSIMTKTDVQYVLWPDEDFMKKTGNMKIERDEDLSGQYFGKKGDRHTGIHTQGSFIDVLLVTFTQDIGYELEKEEECFLYVKRNRNFIHNRISCKFKVIKKEGEKCWAVFYAEVGDDIVKGYMIFE